MTQLESDDNQGNRENNIRKRTQARMLSFQVLYMIDVRSNDCTDEIDDFLADHTDDPDIIEF
ncbi:MAG: hypothetical protein KJ645_05495, partial [Planctomycetes bacterium]|nr:hypothetical protein [Planctomycetota bacterium]